MRLECMLSKDLSGISQIGQTSWVGRKIIHLQQNELEGMVPKTVKILFRPRFVLRLRGSVSCVQQSPVHPLSCVFGLPPTNHRQHPYAFEVFSRRQDSTEEATIQQGSTRRLLSTAFGRRATGKRRVLVHPAFARHSLSKT